VLRVRNDGLPIVGFTWSSLTDQVDWNTALREDNGRVNPLGLYDLSRTIRPVGTAYKELITPWQDVLPTQSVVLSWPVFPPSQQQEAALCRMERSARERERRSRTVLGKPASQTLAEDER
jgi:beta-glucosidase